MNRGLGKRGKPIPPSKICLNSKRCLQAVCDGCRGLSIGYGKRNVIVIIVPSGIGVPINPSSGHC